jgi:hypothetical protein
MHLLTLNNEFVVYPRGPRGWDASLRFYEFPREEAKSRVGFHPTPAGEATLILNIRQEGVRPGEHVLVSVAFLYGEVR